MQAGELETRDAPVSEPTDKTSPDYDVSEGTTDQVPVTEQAGQEQAKESQQEEERGQQKTVPETQPQRDEETATTPEEVKQLCSQQYSEFISVLLILFPFQVPGDSQPTRSNQVSLINIIIHYCMIIL